MEKNQVTSNFLRALADAVDRLSAKEFEEVLNAGGLKSLISSPGDKRRVRKAFEDRADLREPANALMEELARATSREEARAFLDNRRPTRAILLEAAKSRSVHVVKDDTIRVIIDKLIANTVGSRLDSDAIRNG